MIGHPGAHDVRPRGNPCDMASRADRQRAAMVEDLRARGITDERVLSAMGSVPRERFVPPDLADAA